MDADRVLVEDYFGDRVPCHIDEIDKSVKLTECFTYLNTIRRMMAHYKCADMNHLHLISKSGIAQMFLNLIDFDNSLEKAKWSYELIKKIIDPRFVLSQFQKKFYLAFYYYSDIFFWILDTCYHDKCIDMNDFLLEKYSKHIFVHDNIALKMIERYKIDVCNDAFFFELLKHYDNPHPANRITFMIFLQKICYMSNEKCLINIKKESEMSDFFQNFSTNEKNLLLNIIIRLFKIGISANDTTYLIIRIFTAPVDNKK